MSAAQAGGVAVDGGEHGDLGEVAGTVRELLERRVEGLEVEEESLVGGACLEGHGACFVVVVLRSWCCRHSGSGSSALAAALLMLAPATLMGVVFPLGTRCLVDERRRCGAGVGSAYLVNTFGTVLGSLATAFALIPLLIFCRNRGLMGGLVNHRLTTTAATVVVALIVSLNIFLLYQTFFG